MTERRSMISFYAQNNYAANKKMANQTRHGFE
jgi:hypothetical protein